MGKSDVTTEQEFAKLEQVLNQTADDASTCLKLLKKHLSEYDSRNGNHFKNTATSYMRSDMRTAKDQAKDLKHVAHDISKSHKPSESEITSARNMKDATSKILDILKTTARNYDKENGQRMGVKGKVDAAVGGHRKDKNEHGLLGNKDHKYQHGHKDQQHGLLGQNKDENHGVLGDKHKESEGGLFGKSKDEGEGGGLFGKSDKEKHQHENRGVLGGDEHHGVLGGDDKNSGGLFGKSDKDKYEHRGVGGMLGSEDKNGGGVIGSSETVETIVTKTLREHFSVRALDHQITAAETSLKPSIIDRAKEKIHDVKDKIKGDKSSSTHEGPRQHEGHHVDP